MNSWYLAGIGALGLMANQLTVWGPRSSALCDTCPVVEVDVVSRNEKGHGAADRVQRGGRRYRPVRFQQKWGIGGSAADTMILLPQQIVSTQRHVVIYDAIARRLLGLNPESGRIEWRAGRPGRGPGEFAGVGLMNARPEGGVHILDLGASRLSAVGEDGKMGDYRDHPLGANPRGICDLGDTYYTLRGGGDAELQRVERRSGTERRFSLPWPEVDGQPSITRQSKVFAYPGAGVCMLALSFGPRYALLDTSGVRMVGTWVEHVPLAKAVSLGKGSWRMAPGSVLSAQSATGVGAAFSVLFEGTSPDKLRVLDFYAVTDGRYLFSVRLPFEARYIGYGHGLLILAGETNDGEPYVRALRAAPTLETLVAEALQQ